jgi:PAS domain S-box-containing protein
MDSSTQRHDRYAILKIIGIYLFFGVLWIYFSDTVLAWLVRDANVMTYVQISKGILFILITALLLYVLIHTYVDRLRRMNRTLQEREILLHSIATNIPGVAYQFVATDTGGCNVSYVSERLTETFGLSTEIDAFFPMFADHVVEEDRGRFLGSLREAVACGAPWRLEGRFVRPDGEPLWFQAIATPKREGTSTLYHGVLLDITERKRAEEDLRRLNFAIEQARKRPHHRPGRSHPVRESGLRESHRIQPQRGHRQDSVAPEERRPGSFLLREPLEDPQERHDLERTHDEPAQGRKTDPGGLHHQPPAHLDR